MSGSGTTADVLAVSVHGPVGVLDLRVPTAASGVDVAEEYARQTGLERVPALRTRLGRELPGDLALGDAGVRSGWVLVAVDPADAGRAVAVDDVPRAAERRATYEPGGLSVLWLGVVVGVALLGAWFGALLPEGSDARTWTVGLLLAGCGLGLLPLGPLAEHRVLAAPALAGSAVLVLTWDPSSVRFPTVLGLVALGAAVAAALGRALATWAEEGLRVWVTVGTLLFVLTVLAAFADVPARLTWAVLLLVATLAARFVPLVAVDVPDQYLIDLERLAVTAWSARERPRGRRTRMVVPERDVAVVAARGARMVTASTLAVLLVVSVSSVLLLREATVTIDLVGARLEVFFAGGALLLAGRSYRHAAPRLLLRLAGLVCWAALSLDVLLPASADLLSLVAGGAIGLGGLMVVVAVALGRGWRSAWWSRRAEVGESLCGAFTMGSVVVAGGLFEVVWRITG